MQIGLTHYLTASGILFAIGIAGIILRRDMIIIYMCLEIMLNAANLALVAFSRYNSNLSGQVLVFFVITVAAAEVAVGLALIVALFRVKHSTKAEDITLLKF
ncbi:NADH-quinone oxidoreductase subunit NuoK [Candidatus Methylacidiphilum fumarolicum]|uniref:NADH-quinone oxidoreductase subunit K n=2 Tax=Candidatus Methylacidiphilum fumarolicum TaxID=591154 RepID=I0K0W5_METFB|nr:NADH-quinone oxidoreductase subunit NuoK [Candidatus Methylacidiphilum fumarolicum]MBW6413993.1 NADH-quinone oxidoreductase subunit NuoK [Candidatus Methylacidiphilum fumarolicum]TFE70533.1 NADH-quinone oxidoreductase subunit K [Candidatus Methylacidiphilum fumarolicum]TFE74756.1 NADH-quinone oxidoreductase subunit NuoK [Candidatus Methylacidiphilum fumarolicum]TFE76001.1 NADH-quinone oxidoreductase subunit NuoK [Candidatus Methylacidiphilum fumarolicum]TFE76419.1 NADH-quinone oxidoreductas